jgi:hypothetical protein
MQGRRRSTRPSTHNRGPRRNLLPVRSQPHRFEHMVSGVEALSVPAGQLAPIFLSHFSWFHLAGRCSAGNGEPSPPAPYPPPLIHLRTALRPPWAGCALLHPRPASRPVSRPCRASRPPQRRPPKKDSLALPLPHSGPIRPDSLSDSPRKRTRSFFRSPHSDHGFPAPRLDLRPPLTGCLKTRHFDSHCHETVRLRNPGRAKNLPVCSSRRVRATHWSHYPSGPGRERTNGT